VIGPSDEKSSLVREPYLCEGCGGELVARPFETYCTKCQALTLLYATNDT
jgi:hypothetical protein